MPPIAMLNSDWGYFFILSRMTLAVETGTLINMRFQKEG
jgi:hypothetical protein